MSVKVAEANFETLEHEKQRTEFLSYFRESQLPHPDQWPDQSPVFVTASTRAPKVNYQLNRKGGIEGDNEKVSPFPLDGSAIPFDGPLFRGKIVSRMRDVPAMVSPGQETPPVCPSEDYFKGRSRQFQWTVQGVFSKRCRFDEVVTGQDFDRPFRNAPSGAIVKRGIDLMRSRLPENFEIDLFADKPRFEHPLINGCQYFRVDKLSSLDGVSDDKLFGEGEQGTIVEECSLLGPAVPKSSEKRRKFFSKQENLEKYYFEPDEYVYTFDFYANFFTPARHRLEITSFFSIDLIPYFNGQPLFMAMAKMKKSGEYLWATETWHKRLLEYDVKEGLLKKMFGGSKKSKKKIDNDASAE